MRCRDGLGGEGADDLDLSSRGGRVAGTVEMIKGESQRRGSEQAGRRDD
jgi:hypothetical protein